METDKRKKRKGIIVLTVIVIFSATCYFGYEYYKQQQTEKIIAYYNDINNFKDFTGGIFLFEKYDCEGHIEEEDTPGMNVFKIEKDLLKLYPVGSDHRNVVVALLKSGMQIVKISEKGTLTFGKIVKVSEFREVRLRKWPWLTYEVSFTYGVDNKIISFGGKVIGSYESKQSAIYRRSGCGWIS